MWYVSCPMFAPIKFQTQLSFIQLQSYHLIMEARKDSRVTERVLEIEVVEVR